MNLKEKIRKALLKEDKGNVYEYGCVMLYLSPDETWWNNRQSSISEDDIYRGTEEDPGYARENEPHVTILYGIHSDVPDEKVEEMISKMTGPELTLKEISMFDNAHRGFDVVKFDIESDDLREMNNMFKELPHTNDYPDYHAHATIAYTKAGTGKKYVTSLDDDASLKLVPHKIVYSKPDGSKKEYNFSS
jgi:2'-5' RNA ligase